MFRNSIMGVILAGGAGKRLKYLTSDVRAQSAVPFGGKYRIIDFVLSSFFNSCIKKLYVLIQYKSISLSEHIQANWAPRFGSKDEFIRVAGPVPPNWQKGSADSVNQILSRIKIENPDHVAVFGGDQICSFDIRETLKFHESEKADLTICSMKYPLKKAAGKFGILEVADDGSLLSFCEKAEHPIPLKQDRKYTLISLGNYIFSKNALIEAVEYDSSRPDGESSHDFGKDVIPMMIKSGRYKICVYDISMSEHSFWHSIGSIDEYFDVSMLFLDYAKTSSLYDPSWPIYSVNADNLPPVRIDEYGDGEFPEIKKSIVSDGCVIRGSKIEKSILSPGVFINENSKIKRSVLLNDVKVGKNCVLENVIADKRSVIPSGVVIKNGVLSKNKALNQEEETLFEVLKSKLYFTDSKIALIPCYHDYSDKL